MNTKRTQILYGTILAVSLSSTAVRASENSSDWRTDYKTMVGAYYTNNYDEAINDAQTCLDKISHLTNPTEKSVALDELIKYLNMIGGRNGQQQNYSQQEQLLKCKLKAYDAKNDGNCANNYQITQIKKDLATCLVLQGKSKEAETYLSKTEKSRKSDNLTGWKKDIDLLSEANNNRCAESQVGPDKLCEYAATTINDVLSIKNATEKEVAVSQLTQQLQIAEYRYKSDKDYSHEEKILKLLLKIQEAPTAEDNLAVGANMTGYLRTSTLKELVTCLVMQNKDDEAADYNKIYKEEIDKLTKNREKMMKTFMERAKPVINDKEKPAEQPTP